MYAIVNILLSCAFFLLHISLLCIFICMYVSINKIDIPHACPVRVVYSALPKGAYVEDRILQRRERRLASPGKYTNTHN